MPIRLLPRSIAGQLLGLLLGALVLGQIATLLLYAESRRSAIEAAAREQVLGRTAALVRLIEDTPPALHPLILETASSNRLVYTVDPNPAVTRSGMSTGEGFAISALDEIFGDGREVRAELHGRPLRARARDRRESDDRDRPDHDEAERRDRDQAGRGDRDRAMIPTVAVSVRLTDGRWLNAETVLPRPPFWAWPTVTSTLLIALLLAVVVILSVRRITKPLRRLADASDRFGRGEAVPKLAEEGPEEVRRTVRAFNAMQDRVGRFVADRTRMLAAISHDLRTPLTALRLRAEFVDDPEIRDKIVDTVDEMSRMTEATLAFAREDAAAEEARPTDMTALVKAVVDDFSDLGGEVTVTAPDRLDHVVRPVALRRALRNLVENAIRYGGRADVALRAGPDDIVIEVDDSGPGIPEDRLEDVFEPFVRLEGSRSVETGGVGLGLSTARSIVRAHGGELTLANRPEGGLRAVIRLPKGRR